jgi:acyl dehydratase
MLKLRFTPACSSVGIAFIAKQALTTIAHRLLRVVPVIRNAVGKQFEPITYAVGREKIREYAAAVGETNPLYFDLDAVRRAGYADLVAPPMFVVVYAGRSVGPAVVDPDVGINLAMMVHGGQEFRWGPLVVAGDEITTTTTVKEITERGGMTFYVFESVSENQRGEITCRGIWTNIVRGAG